MSIRLFSQEELARIGSFLRLTSYKLSRQKLAETGHSDEWTSPTHMVDVYRKDSVAGLLHFEDQSRQAGDEQRHLLFMVEQFRFSTVIDGFTGQPDLTGSGLFLELMAGSCEVGEPPLETFIRETEEETAFEVDHSQVKLISSFYPSPGACSEKIHLYYCRIKFDPAAKEEKLFGYDEQEDIRRVKMTVREFLSKIERNEILDAKAFIAAEWMRRDEHKSQFGL